MKNYLVLLLVGVTIGFGCTKVLDQSASTEILQPLEPVLNPGAVFAVFHADLREGVSEEEFVEYTTKEFFPAFNSSMPDVKWMLLKSDRGDKKGTYAWIGYCPDFDTREKYFPSDGGLSPEAQQIFEQHSDLSDRFFSYVDRSTESTRDYIVIE